jgi:hypothetical protein
LTWINNGAKNENAPNAPDVGALVRAGSILADAPDFKSGEVGSKPTRSKLYYFVAYKGFIVKKKQRELK